MADADVYIHPSRSTNIATDLRTSSEQPTPAVEPPDVSNEPASASNKRRRSDASDSSNKRLRLEADHVDPNAVARKEDSPAASSTPSRPAPSRRRDFRDEDRKRGQRLFGGLLGALGGGGAAARRKKPAADIQQRQKRAPEAEPKDDVTRKREHEELIAARREEQKRLDQDAMRLRHQNMRAMARHLKTKAQPQIYYLPSQLSLREEEIIQQQTAEVEAQIAKELAELPQGATSSDLPNANLQHAEDGTASVVTAAPPPEVNVPEESMTDTATAAKPDHPTDLADQPMEHDSAITNPVDEPNEEQQIEENESDKDEAEGAGDGEDTLVY